MPDSIRHPSRLPKYRHYTPKNLAVVRIDGRDIYLGKYDSPESREKYNRVIAEWLTSGVVPDPARLASGAPAVPTVNELMADYIHHVDSYYVKNGKPTSEATLIRLSLRVLREHYGRTPAKDFGPLALKAVRQAYIASGLCRTEVNRRTGHVVRFFKWAVENERVPSSVHHGLKAVPGLRKGRTEVRESAPVRPVPDAFVDAIESYVSRRVWAMVQIQRLTGMRPGEVTVMRTRDLDTSGAAWVYRPESHKTEHHGKSRQVILGPRARAILKPWLKTDLGEFLFSPKESAAETSAAQRQARKSPLTPSQRARTRKRKPKRTPGDCYTANSYRHAVAKGCKRAGVPTWHPSQLRHNAATALRREFGLDTARAVLGHSDVGTTTIYAERDAALASTAMERLG